MNDNARRRAELQAGFRKVLLIKEVAERTRVPEATLRWYRAVGDRGPKSFKLGGKRIAYYEDDVEAWMKEQYERDNPAA